MKYDAIKYIQLLVSLCILVGSLTNEVQGNLSSGIKVKSCLELFYTSNKTLTNGHYAIHTGLSLTPVYCDFQSDPPYVWTLVESFTRNRGIQTSKLPESINFRKPYYYNYPYNECTPQFQAYRLSHASMKSIYDSPRTTHWRATCNFDKKKKYPISHRDYMRVENCRYNIMAIYNAQPGCYIVDYVNVRGYTCKMCQLPIYVSPSYHVTFLSSRTYSYCQKWKFPSEYGFNPPESNFGYFSQYSIDHECSSSKDATTNYWFGGVYQPESKLISYKLL
ncbi:uncharacterized protein TRIADDRAFT_59872 [Trichoplax adhaerens]|uniref:Uncharacterized protein n=1 Tax=Trichoplax adhaerens TaxID=10228 RepID=B3S6N8_TRIAD|nr:predicted protein [Trichoplax adhaerens]EDV21788.1 predicted protein [Trichoplax adhaerens]|eukprot:XP_002115936.1 predicted protein [Trichoplax adhaerens]